MLHRRYLTWALVLLTCACRSRPSTSDDAADMDKQLEPDMEMFAPASPIEGADASMRHNESVDLPTRIRVQLQGNVVAYGVDEKSLQKVTLNVGYKMILGEHLVWTVRSAEQEPEWICEGKGTLCYGESSSTGYWYGLEEPGRSFTDFSFEAAIEVFETDIPARHIWVPSAGHYRVLWRKTLRSRPRDLIAR